MTSRPAPMRASGTDPLPSAELVAQVKRTAFMAACARCLDLPWPPGPDAHALIDLSAHVALAVLEAVCPQVASERLARCLGLHPVIDLEALAMLRASSAWPAEVFRAAVAAIEGLYPALAPGGGEAAGRG